MTSSTNKLYSLEWLEVNIANWKALLNCGHRLSPHLVDMAQQLADTMRDNTQLIHAISMLSADDLSPKQRRRIAEVASSKHRDQLNSVNKEDGDETNTDKS